MTQKKVTLNLTGAPTFILAGFVSRSIAFFIDLMLIFTIVFLTIVSGGYFLKDYDINLYSLPKLFHSLFFLLTFLASAYFVLLHSFEGQTIGKMLLRIRLITDKGSLVGPREAFIRWLGYYMSLTFIFIGFIVALFDPKRQTWHDKIANTFVIKDK